MGHEVKELIKVKRFSSVTFVVGLLSRPIKAANVYFFKWQTIYESPEFFRFMRQLLKIAQQVRGSYLHLISNTALHITFLSYIYLLFYLFFFFILLFFNLIFLVFMSNHIFVLSNQNGDWLAGHMSCQKEKTFAALQNDHNMNNSNNNSHNNNDLAISKICNIYNIINN